jgi:hypothetical protein
MNTKPLNSVAHKTLIFEWIGFCVLSGICWDPVSYEEESDDVGNFVNKYSYRRHDLTVAKSRLEASHKENDQKSKEGPEWDREVRRLRRSLHVAEDVNMEVWC